MQINIKPLSVNEAWQGKRFKTKQHANYCTAVHAMLPPCTPAMHQLIDSKAPMTLAITFGLSSKNADIDNPVKPFIDCLQRKYGFNDKLIYQLAIEKVNVKNGKEYISFAIDSQ